MTPEFLNTAYTAEGSDVITYLCLLDGSRGDGYCVIIISLTNTHSIVIFITFLWRTL